MIRPISVAVFAFCAALAAPVAAQDLSAGLAAYREGDYATALENWRPLAEQGNAFAQYSLGVMYDTGRGVPQDYTEAARWFRLAAEQGHASAQFNFGLMYRNGDGVPQDDAEAVRWYRLAAEQGDASAQFNLGIMYSNGDGVPQNYILVHMWFNLAGANGEEAAPEGRRLVEELMTREQIADAQARARVCLSSDYQDCD